MNYTTNRTLGGGEFDILQAMAKIETTGRLPRAFGHSAEQLRCAVRGFCSLAKRCHGKTFRHVVLHLQDDAGSDCAHQAVMGVDGATDVITQRYDPIAPEPPGVYGELFVNAQRALSAGCRGGRWSPWQELLLYATHGVDHLCGEDDSDERGYRAMRRRELGWVRRLLPSTF